MAWAEIQGMRSPMASLRSQGNVPIKRTFAEAASSQDLVSKKRGWKQIDAKNPNPRIKKVKTTNEETTAISSDNGQKPEKIDMICHQCRQPVQKSLTIQCTRFKKAGLGEGMGRCAIRYCAGCLLNRYGERASVILSTLAVEDEDEEYVWQAGYVWACPVCRGECNCSVHRKKAGLLPTGRLHFPVKEPAAEKNKEITEDMETYKKARRKKERPAPSNQHGIASFFQKKTEESHERRTPEAAKLPENFEIPEHILIAEIVKPKAAKPQIKPPLKVVNPPTFLPVRTAANPTCFLHRLKVREFVLQFEKVFTRKLHVPTKHITRLADPCDTPPDLSMKHLFSALFHIIQADLENKDEQDQIKETMRKIDKSAAGSEIIQKSVIEWLTFMDPRVMAKIDVKKGVDDMVLATMLIDRAISSATCREEMENNLEALRLLKSANTAAAKALRTEWEERKAALHKERLKIIDRETVDEWKQEIAELESEFKSETTRLANEIWIESRRLSPRTTCLGTDVKGNKYWLFSSRKIVSRRFGGFLTIQSPSNTLPTGDEATAHERQEDDGYTDLGGWWYVSSAKDIRQLAKWTMYLASKAAADKERRIAEAGRGKLNGKGQRFSVEIVSPVKLKERRRPGRKVVEDAGVVDTRVLVEELVHAAEWIEEKWPEEEEAVEEVPQEKETVVIDGEIIVLDD